MMQKLFSIILIKIISNIPFLITITMSRLFLLSIFCVFLLLSFSEARFRPKQDSSCKKYDDRMNNVCLHECRAGNNRHSKQCEECLRKEDKKKTWFENLIK